MNVTRKAKALVNYLPSPVQRLGKSIYVRRRFKTELELIEGRHHNENEHPSIVHFSFNKAATQYVKSVLRRCAVESGMVPVAIHDYAFHTDFPRLHHLPPEEVSKYSHIFREKGYLYSVFGGMIEGLPHLDRYKVVLVARDPRDMLVSGYFSIAYSHSVPSKTGDKYEGFMQQRREARGLTIDDYVVAESDKVLEQFLRYQTLLDEHPDMYLTTYERLAVDFEGWLGDLIEYCELDVSSSLFESIVRENERATPKKENVHQHLRKGQAGDYKEKLKPETIEYLDVKFASVLARYGYDATLRDVR